MKIETHIKINYMLVGANGIGALFNTAVYISTGSFNHLLLAILNTGAALLSLHVGKQLELVRENNKQAIRIDRDIVRRD